MVSDRAQAGAFPGVFRTGLEKAAPGRQRLIQNETLPPWEASGLEFEVALGTFRRQPTGHSCGREHVTAQIPAR
jgi:hypothetical protein